MKNEFFSGYFPCKGEIFLFFISINALVFYWKLAKFPFFTIYCQNKLYSKMLFFKCLILLHKTAIIWSKIDKIREKLSKYKFSWQLIFFKYAILSQKLAVILPKIGKIRDYLSKYKLSTQMIFSLRVRFFRINSLLFHRKSAKLAAKCRNMSFPPRWNF